jgi:hypothetical protein
MAWRHPQLLVTRSLLSEDISRRLVRGEPLDSLPFFLSHGIRPPDAAGWETWCALADILLPADP